MKLSVPVIDLFAPPTTTAVLVEGKAWASDIVGLAGAANAKAPAFEWLMSEHQERITRTCMQQGFRLVGDNANFPLAARFLRELMVTYEKEKESVVHEEATPVPVKRVAKTRDLTFWGLATNMVSSVNLDDTVAMKHAFELDVNVFEITSSQLDKLRDVYAKLQWKVLVKYCSYFMPKVEGKKKVNKGYQTSINIYQYSL